MTTHNAQLGLSDRLDRVVERLPQTCGGPGGAVAVVREGEVLVRHAWGWANAEQRIAFTPRTMFRICSITKQFVCALLLDAFPDPSVLDGDVRDRLRNLEEPAPGALHLCHNQSGLRDYWALAMLHGAPAEGSFGEVEARRVIDGARSLQFAAGTRYSYANQNFRILADIAQARAGRDLETLLRDRIFDHVGMADAFLAADTRAMPDGTVGYEGSVADGFRPAENAILWTGDAGIGASLDDMIAWERHIDAARDDPDGLYTRLTAPVCFADGAAANYGFGLGRSQVLGRPVTAHGGGLRGWRSVRFYAPGERVSVVVLFNHMAEPHAAAMALFAAVLDQDIPGHPAPSPAPPWLGTYLEPLTGLATRVDASPDGRIRLRYGTVPEMLDVAADGGAGTGPTRLASRNDGLWLERPQDNQRSLLIPRPGAPTPDIAGRYECAELAAEITIADAGGALFGAFSGFLGAGRMELLEPVGQDLWSLPCPRALDYSPPGDWTLGVVRGDDSAVLQLQVGCWLARGLTYTRVS